jgi:mRNA-degrading endonuclease RelE of RelBE toxin-antitoxin system
MTKAYIVEFAESVKKQIRDLPARQRALLIDSIEKQLVHEPLTETRNRKPLRPNPIAPWELRVGNLRVFYEVVSDEPNVVRILAVGRKRGNKLLIAGKEVQL